MATNKELNEALESLRLMALKVVWAQDDLLKAKDKISKAIDLKHMAQAGQAHANGYIERVKHEDRHKLLTAGVDPSTVREAGL